MGLNADLNANLDASLKRSSIADIRRASDIAARNISTITEMVHWSRLLGLRVAARMHPDISELVYARIHGIIDTLDRAQLETALLAALNTSSIMYAERDPEHARKEADNIAGALREARDHGGLR